MTIGAVTGIYEGEPIRDKRGRPVTKIFYRNHEIYCLKCDQMVRTMPISIVKAAFGIKIHCNLCGHDFVYTRPEVAA